MNWSYENQQTNKNRSINRFPYLGIVSISSLVILLLGFFILPLGSASESTHATGHVPPDPDSTEPTISITPNDGIKLNMTPASGTGGSFGTTTANVTINTTGTTGYTFTMNTETTNADLTNSKIDYTQSANENLKIANLTTSTTESNFSPNTWGYNVNKNGIYLKGANNTYLPVPNSGSSEMDRQVEITDSAGSNTYTFTYGVKANNNLPAGDYSTTLVFSATANVVPKADCSVESCTIIYDRNGSTSNNGISATHTNVKSGDSINLYPVNDYKTDYGFAGWSTDPDAGTKIASNDVSIRNIVTVYGPMETITVGDDLLDAADATTNNITLYAVWVASAGTMQSFNTTACNNLTQATYDATTGVIAPGQVTARKDNRDNNTYAIARLSDGRCWMMENLRLGPNVALNSSNTQNPSIASTPVNSTANWSSATTNALRADNITSPIVNMTAKDNNVYSYGVYYTWYTATAGRAPSDDTSTATGSICPYNWSMPHTTSSSTGSFGYLANTMDTTSDATKASSLRRYPNNFLYSGAVVSGEVYSRGGLGFYWTRVGFTPSSYGYAYYAAITDEAFSGASFGYRYYGPTVRCIVGT